MSTHTQAWHEQYRAGIPNDWRRSPSYGEVALNTLGTHRWVAGISMLVFGCCWAMKGGRPWAVAKYSLFTSVAFWFVDRANRRRAQHVEDPELSRKVYQIHTTIVAFRTAFDEILSESASPEDRAKAFDAINRDQGEELIRLFRDAPREIGRLVDLACLDKTFDGYTSWLAQDDEIPGLQRQGNLSAQRAEDLLKKLAPHCQTVPYDEELPMPKMEPTIDRKENYTRRTPPTTQRGYRREMHSPIDYTGACSEVMKNLEDLDHAVWRADGKRGEDGKRESKELKIDRTESNNRDMLTLALLFGPFTCWVIT